MQNTTVQTHGGRKQVTSTTATVLEIPEQITACCPTCGQTGTFTHIGVQTWPERVAAAMNINPTTHLWRCEQCQTTVTDIHLND